MCALKFFQRSNARLHRKPNDYRISLFNLFVRTLKACRLFLIQKIVKKLKETKEDSSPHAILSISNNKNIKIEKLNEDLAFLKEISKKDVKEAAVFILVNELNLNLEKQKAFFTKNIDNFEKFVKKEANQVIKKFVDMAKNIKKYRDSQEQVEKIMGKVKKKIQKTKQERKNFIKSKKKTEINNIQNSEPVENEDNFSQEKSKTKAKIINKDLKKTEKSDFSKKNRPFKKRHEKMDSDEKFIANKENKRIIKKNNVSFQETQNLKKNNGEKAIPLKNSKITTDYEEIHPSWEARLSQKKQEANLTFMGVKKKLS
jgi:hypothetical protein